MAIHTVNLQLPENIYLRLEQTAQATQQPLEHVLLHAVKVGSPPPWDDVPAEFQPDLASLDRLDDDALWQIAQSQQSKKEAERVDLLLEKKANNMLSTEEKQALENKRTQGNRFILRKAQAAALLRWRGHSFVPPTNGIST